MDIAVAGSIGPSSLELVTTGIQAPSGPLTNDENDELGIQEHVIRKDLELAHSSLQRVGKALSIIREKKLYRGKSATFEAYLEETWAISRSYAYRLMQAYQTVQELLEAVATPKMLPIGNKIEEGAKLATAVEGMNESALREARKIDSESRGEVVMNAIVANDYKPATATQIKQAASGNGFESNPDAERRSFESAPPIAESSTAANPAAKPFKNGQAVVNSKDREIALKAVGELTRRFDSLGLLSRFKPYLDEMLIELKSLGGRKADLTFDDPDEDDAVEIVKPVSRNLF